MSILLDDGRKIDVDLNNEINTQTGLYKNSINTEKSNNINLVGEYKYDYSNKYADLTNNQPVIIQRKSATQLGVQGQIYDWDEEANDGKGGVVYRDIQDYLLDRNDFNMLYESPEQLEVWLDALFDHSQKVYNEHTKPAKL